MNSKSFNPRTIYAQCLLRLAERDSRVYVVTSDLSTSFKTKDFERRFPERFVNVGVAEANMIGVAAGLALEGKIPFACSIAPFATMRCCEQIRTDVCYNELPVRIVSIMSGLTGAPLGTTHYCTEDIGIFRTFSNMCIFVPADAYEIEQIMVASLNIPDPVYIRLGALDEPVVNLEPYHFILGKSNILRTGQDLALIACGYMVHIASKVAKMLESVSIHSTLVNVHTIKPLDKETIIEVTRRVPLVVTLEEHNIFGGLGSAVAEVLAEAGRLPPLLRIGVPDQYAGVGERMELFEDFQMDPSSVANRIQMKLKEIGIERS